MISNQENGDIAISCDEEFCTNSVIAPVFREALLDAKNKGFSIRKDSMGNWIHKCKEHK